MKIFAIILTLFFTTNVYAGAGWICDDYGHSCLKPGGNCNALIPPAHICEEDELSFLQIRYIDNVRVQDAEIDESFLILQFE